MLFGKFSYHKLQLLAFLCIVPSERAQFNYSVPLSQQWITGKLVIVTGTSFLNVGWNISGYSL